MSVGIFSTTTRILNINELYDPALSDQENDQRIIPKVGSVVVSGSALYVVTAVDATTFKSTLAPGTILVGDDSTAEITSVVSYKNDIFRAYYTKRTIPTKITPDGLLYIAGSRNFSYRLTRLKSDGLYETISAYYNEDGTYASALAPMEPLSDGSTNWRYCLPCYTNVELVDGETVYLEVINTFGEMTARVNLITRECEIINTLDNYTPTIVDITITGSQMTTDGDLYIFEKQDVESLSIMARITYDNGFVRDVSIDGNQCRLYGVDDFTAGYPGLRQPLTLKYYLSEDELARSITTINGSRFVVADTNLIVMPSEAAYSIKISTIPLWDSVSNRWKLRFMAYDLDGQWMEDVTTLVSYPEVFSGLAYGVYQTLTLRLDLSKMQHTSGVDSTLHQQTVSICLSPNSAIEKYIIKDHPDATTVYGVNASDSRRPILAYDAARKQYYIPTSTFLNKESVIRSFYLKASPPFNTATRIDPITPTHFTVRDPTSAATAIRVPLDLDTYATAFNIIDTFNPGQYLNGQVVVEFLMKVDDTNYLVLYGVPVDVVAGTYQG